MPINIQYWKIGNIISILYFYIDIGAKQMKFTVSQRIIRVPIRKNLILSMYSYFQNFREFSKQVPKMIEMRSEFLKDTDNFRKVSRILVGMP